MYTGKTKIVMAWNSDWLVGVWDMGPETHWAFTLWVCRSGRSTFLILNLKSIELNRFELSFLQLSSVQSLSRVWLFATPWTTARQASLFITNSQSTPKPCSLSQWCHPTISSSIIPFSCPQSIPASESFAMSQLFAWGGQSIGISASASSFQWTTRTGLL